MYKEKLINSPIMEAARTCETSVTIYQITRRNNPEDSHLILITVKRKVTAEYPVLIQQTHTFQSSVFHEEESHTVGTCSGKERMNAT
jgi:hypothetical protein